MGTHVPEIQSFFQGYLHNFAAAQISHHHQQKGKMRHDLWLLFSAASGAHSIHHRGSGQLLPLQERLHASPTTSGSSIWTPIRSTHLVCNLQTTICPPVSRARGGPILKNHLKQVNSIYIPSPKNHLKQVP